LAWMGGKAWAETCGPAIDMSDLEYDPRWLAYFVTVVNLTTQPTTPKVFLANVTDEHGKKLPLWMKTLEAHWRNCRPDERPELSVRGARADACLLKSQENTTDSGLACLWAYPLDQELVAVSYFSPIKNPETIHVTIVASYENKNGDAGNTITKKFELKRIVGTTAYAIRRLTP
jgi:hypothetical protein